MLINKGCFPHLWNLKEVLFYSDDNKASIILKLAVGQTHILSPNKIENVYKYFINVNVTYDMGFSLELLGLTTITLMMNLLSPNHHLGYLRPEDQ